jgi:hypothetical protein
VFAGEEDQKRGAQRRAPRKSSTTGDYAMSDEIKQEAAAIPERRWLPTINGQASADWHWVDEGFSGTWPALYELMASAKDQFGKYRAGATVMMFAEGGRLKACINDKWTNSSAFLTIDPRAGLYDQLEEAIRAGLDWRKKGARRN